MSQGHSKYGYIEKARYKTYKQKISEAPQTKWNRPCNECGTNVEFKADNYSFRTTDIEKNKHTLCKSCYIKMVDNYEGELV